MSSVLKRQWEREKATGSHFTAALGNKKQLNLSHSIHYDRCVNTHTRPVVGSCAAPPPPRRPSPPGITQGAAQQERKNPKKKKQMSKLTINCVFLIVVVVFGARGRSYRRIGGGFVTGRENKKKLNWISPREFKCKFAFLFCFIIHLSLNETLASTDGLAPGWMWWEVVVVVVVEAAVPFPLVSSKMRMDS